MHRHTPLVPDRAASLRLDADVRLKLDTLQPTGSFKLRGMGYLAHRYHAEGLTHMVSSSGGNAGIAAAYAGRVLGMQVTVVVPKTTNKDAIARIRAESAEVVVFGEVWDEADTEARRVAHTLGAGYVSPFDHPALWDGHGTLIDEVVADGFRPDLVIVSVGGGGLLTGVARGLERNDLSETAIVAAETHGAASYSAALRAGRPVDIGAIQSVAKSLGARRVSQAAVDVAATREVLTMQVSDAAAVDASVAFLNTQRMLVEPACGASLALLAAPVPRLERAERVLCVVCGGVTTSAEMLLGWQEMLHQG